MTNEDFWASIASIIADGFTPDGLHTLDRYAEQFISGQLLYKRFSQAEQHGCAAGGETHVVASLLAAASHRADSPSEQFTDFQAELKLAAAQEQLLEQWSRAVNCWIDDADIQLSDNLGAQIAEGGEANVYFKDANLVKTIRLDYYIQPILALDRISLHNAWFPETTLTVLGFGRTSEGKFVIITQQPFIQGTPITEKEIEVFVKALGFNLVNPRNWTYSTPEIYLSDLHDENVIKSPEGNIFVIDCDIRINTPMLKCGGVRHYNLTVEFVN